jgi:hypothetical protein
MTNLIGKYDNPIVMKRRNFTIASGSAIISGLSTINLQRSATGLKFQLSKSSINVDPSTVNSITLQFDTFKITPRYLDEEKSLSITVRVKHLGAKPRGFSYFPQVISTDFSV